MNAERNKAYLIRMLVRKCRILCWGALCFSLSGCLGNNQDLHDHFEKVRKRPGKSIQPIPEFKPTKKFAYPLRAKRRNPFFKYQPESVRRLRNKKDENAPDLTRPRQPLENYKLSTLKFVGVMEQGPRIWGLIKAPDDLIFKVKVGSYLGKNFGKVLKINKRAINVEERVKVKKRWTKRLVKLNLNTKKFQYGKVVEE